MAYAESHLPMLFNLLDGKTGVSKVEKENPVASLINAAGNSLAVNDGPEESQQKVVAVLNIKSPIYKYDQQCGPSGTQSKIAALERLKNNAAIAGVVLDIDSGGGQAYGTPEFYDYLKTYPKPVVTYTSGLMASAGYYIGSAASHIVANKRAEAIGSIGAYTQMLDLSGYYEKQGVKIHTIYAEKSTEKNKAYRDALAGDYKAYIKEELNPLVDDFIADIKAARPNVSEDVFKGATYSGPAALKKGLIDSLGTLQDAVDKVFELSNSNINNTQTNMSKPNSYPNLEAVLGLSEPLASTEDGSFLNEDQKQVIEDQLTASAADVQAANDAKATAEADLAAEKATAQTALEAATATSESVLVQLKAVATEAGVENIAENATSEEIQTALTAKIQELNGKPGASHTAGAAYDAPAAEHAYIDFTSSIYNTK
jgi:protease-4